MVKHNMQDMILSLIASTLGLAALSKEGSVDKSCSTFKTQLHR